MLLTVSKGLVLVAAATGVLLSLPSPSRAFVPSSGLSYMMKKTTTFQTTSHDDRPLHHRIIPNTHEARLLKGNTRLSAAPKNNDEHDISTKTTPFNVSFNPLYGALWATFLAYGIFFSPGEMMDASDTKLIETLIGDPSNTNGGINPLFFVVFNALGVMPILMAQLALPQGNRQKGVWAAPFVLGSFGAGFGALGLYLTFRAPPVDRKSKAEASWITSNVLENKLFNWINVFLCGTIVVSSGLLSGGAGSVSDAWDGYLQLAATSKLVSVSSIDLMILTISAATLIPRDYSLRVSSEEERKKGTAIAAATVLLPVVGAALYGALRPSLPEESNDEVSQLFDNNDDAKRGSRRSFFNTGAALLLGSGAAMTAKSSPASAAMSQEDIDKANIVKGYQRLQYLLDNWDKETTVCGMGGDKLERSCDRTPIKVMDYLGYKATNDPLFKAEKTLRRLSALSPASRDVEYIEAVDRYVENADEASGMAYISSWGEANPGGGKDRVELFIERARKNVMVARDSLATVMDILGL